MTYNEFIENILNTRGRFACGDQYHERHHIVPKSCGGTNEEANLIDLYAQEHYIAHKLLAQENPDNTKLSQAFGAMAFMMGRSGERYKLSPEEYEEARLICSKALKEKYKDKTKHPAYGTHISEERKQIISQANKGNKYCVGRVLTEETKQKIGNANRNPSQATREKMSKARKGKQMGGNNPRARSVVRLSDGKCYPSAKEAAEDNNISASTMRGWARTGKRGFIYQDLLNNNS